MPRAPFLQPTSRVTSTRRDFPFGDCPPSAVGKPAGVRLSDHPRTGTLAAESDAGPPRGHPASGDSALDGAAPASGRKAVSRGAMRFVIWSAPSFFGCGRLRLFEPSDTFSRDRGDFLHRVPELVLAQGAGPFGPAEHASPWAGERPCSRSREPDSTGARQCIRLSRARGAFHRGRPPPVPLRARVWSVAPAGRQGQSPHVFIAVSKNTD